MNEDYLWDKTGSDAEIEGLENMLSVFRYQETVAPALSTANIVLAAEKSPGWRFSFAYAFAGAMALVLIAIGLFWQMPLFRNPFTVKMRTGQIESEKPVTNQMATMEKALPDVPVSKAVTTQPRPVRQTVHTAFRPYKTVDKQQKVEVKDLTKEEKFAYSQLMLALSITSSKLKVVQNTINRIENDKASDKPNFR